MTYKEFIDNIINTRGQWSEEVRHSILGCERHHITPKCFGGLPKYTTWEHHTNIIWLYPKEHFIAHQLLAQEYPDNAKIVRAFAIMRMGRNKIYSPEDYASLKAAYQHALTLDNPTKREDVRKKISLASQGKIISNETREKISKAGRGRKCSAETRRKLSESNKGKHSHKLSKETRQKMSKDRLGKPKSDLHKLHISQSLSGRKLSEEHKKHLSESRKQSIYRGKNSPRAKRVQCIETLQIFDTIQEACIWAKSCKVGDAANGKRKTAGGYHWKFVD